MADPSAKHDSQPPADSARPRYLASLAGSADDVAQAPARPAASSPWLTYAQAAAYTGWTVAYLRNLVSAGRIPVFGRPRSRRFRRDVLDEYLTDPDAAMRRFRAERNRHHGR